MPATPGATPAPLEQARVSHHQWDDLPLERVKDDLHRRMVAAERMTLAQVRLAKGCIVPEHAHEHEQLSYVAAGRLRFMVSDPEPREVEVAAGAVLHLPSNVPHAAVAEEDSVVYDIFSPPREDWLTGADAYLRK